MSQKDIVGLTLNSLSTRFKDLRSLEGASIKILIL